jgi:hypothetical protein
MYHLFSFFGLYSRELVVYAGKLFGKGSPDIVSFLFILFDLRYTILCIVYF